MELAVAIVNLMTAVVTLGGAVAVLLPKVRGREKRKSRKR